MIALTLLLAASSPNESPAIGPRAWIQHVYAGYANRDFSPFDHPDRYFAPPLLTAINEDSRLAHGEVGYLDGDPLCDCQDFERIRAEIRSLARANRKATARLRVSLGVDQPRNLRLELVQTRAGWRIADIVTPGQGSLLRALEESNRKERARQHQ